jgi:large subunit ribosomal protein L24
MKFKIGDNVKVTTGADRGKGGKIVKIDKVKNRVFVEALNLKKKHRKAGGGKAGQIIEVPASIHASNIAIVDPKTSKPSKIGYAVVKDKKVRIARKSGQQI